MSPPQSLDREPNSWANADGEAGVPIGFAAVAAVNTLVMTVLDRRRELGTLRLIGFPRRQVLHMAAATLPARAALGKETLEE